MVRSVVAALTVMAVTVAALAGEAPGADWPQWRGVNRDANVAQLPTALPAALKPAWQFKVAGECHAGPAVAEGIVVVPDHDETSDYYRALDLATGKELWVNKLPHETQMEYGSGPRATPVIAGGKVVVVGARGDIHCYNLKSGKELWTKDYAKDFEAGEAPNWGFCGSPVLVGDKVVFNTGGKATLVALKIEDGQTVWQSPGGGVEYSSFILGTFGGVQQLVGVDDSLSGYDAATGKRLWKIEIDHGQGYVCPTPVNLGGKLLLSDKANKTQLFTFKDGGAIEPKAVAQNEDIGTESLSPTAFGDLIFHAGADGLVCLDGKELKTLWSIGEDRALGSDLFLILAKDRGLAIGPNGHAALFSYSREGGKVISSVRISDGGWAHPVVAGTKLIARDKEAVYCYELGNSK